MKYKSRVVDQPLQHPSRPGYHHISVVGGMVGVTLNEGRNASKMKVSARQRRKITKQLRRDHPLLPTWGNTL